MFHGNHYKEWVNHVFEKLQHMVNKTPAVNNPPPILNIPCNEVSKEVENLWDECKTLSTIMSLVKKNEDIMSSLENQEQTYHERSNSLMEMYDNK